MSPRRSTITPVELAITVPRIERHSTLNLRSRSQVNFKVIAAEEEDG
jgi:hypothetical protein